MHEMILLLISAIEKRQSSSEQKEKCSSLTLNIKIPLQKREVRTTIRWFDCGQSDGNNKFCPCPCVQATGLHQPPPYPPPPHIPARVIQMWQKYGRCYGRPTVQHHFYLGSSLPPFGEDVLAMPSLSLWPNNGYCTFCMHCMPTAVWRDFLPAGF